jgi:hypothetical protein
MLSYTVIPVALFNPSKGMKNIPTRFADALAEIKGSLLALSLRQSGANS